jgi:hypothetical protein
MTLAGAGFVVGYWVLYFTRAIPMLPADGPPDALEPAFVVADAVLSLTLLAAGHALLAGRPTGPFLVVAGASMCLYLGVLDLTIHARHNLTTPLTAAALFPWLIGALCVAGGSLGIRLGWVLWRDT